MYARRFCINLLEVVTCIVHVVLLHCILNYLMFSLFICIIVNIVFILFYLQVEPVYLRVSNKPIQITSCVINIGNTYAHINLTQKKKKEKQRKKPKKTTT